MSFRLNDPVNTPLGQGLCQGRFEVIERGTVRVEEVVWLVRLPVNDTTRPHLRASNCLTPNAGDCGLWTFEESEIS